MGKLTENQRCPRGPFTRMTEGLSTVGLGGIIGAGLCYVLEERPPGALVLAAAALGGVLASAVRQAVTGRP